MADRADVDYPVPTAISMEQRYITLRMEDAAASVLDGKLQALLGSGGLLAGLVGLTAAVSSATGGIPKAVTIPMVVDVRLAIVVALLAYVAMIFITTRAWTPADYATPGRATWEDAWALGHMPASEAYKQALSDVIEATETARRNNGRKATAVKVAAWLFVLEVAVLILVVIAALMH